MRLFIGIPLPEGAKREISSVVNQLKDFHLPIKWEREEKWHVTLKFLGETEESQIVNIKNQIAKSTLNCGPFFLKPEKVGYFYKGHLIVWVSVNGQLEVLKKLHQQLEENLTEIGIQKEEREFKGHITVGRSQKISSPELKQLQQAILKLKLPKFSEFKVNKINLYKSELKPKGSEYSLVEGFDLSQ